MGRGTAAGGGGAILGESTTFAETAMRLLHRSSLQPEIAQLQRPLRRLEERRVLGEMLEHRLVTDPRLRRRKARIASRREPLKEHLLPRLVEQLPRPGPPHLDDPVLVGRDLQLLSPRGGGWPMRSMGRVR